MHVINSQTLNEAAAVVSEGWPYRAGLGIVLGTGLSAAGNLLRSEFSIPFHGVPHFPRLHSDSDIAVN